MKVPPRTFRPRIPSPAFTLVELLVVMGVVVVLISLAAPAFKSIGSASRLTAAGNRVVNMLNFARQNSASKNAITALLMVTDPANADRNRLFTTMELVAPADGSQPGTNNWRQIGNWERLEQGVIAQEPNGNALLESYPAKSPTPPFPVLQFGGVEIHAYDYVMFLPNGVLLTGNTPQLRLSEGFFPAGAGTPVFTHPAAESGNTPASYYNVFILNATGRVKIERK